MERWTFAPDSCARIAKTITSRRLCAATIPPGLTGPRWLRFVDQTFGGSTDWIQKAVGYTVTGITSEKVAFLLWGVTDTGKSTFLATLRDLFANYSALLQIETLMSKNTDNNTSADLADLRGTRLVITSETEEGHRLREALLKRITQGMGEIKTARKYENPITFLETHKLWMDCNHRPVIRGNDDAIWNRIMPIPCEHQVSAAEKDTNLKEKLLIEKEAIASWAVEGAVRFCREGLGRPEILLRVRDEWRNDMDTIGQFIDECCLKEADARVEASALYEVFREWAKKQGHEQILTQTAFGMRLVDRGYNKGRDPQSRRKVYLGFKLRN